MGLDAQVKMRDHSASANEVDLRSVLGAAILTDWRQAMIARGFGWNVTVGSFSTGIVGGGNGTVLDQDQPELAVAIPTGTALIPLRVQVSCHTPLIAADEDEAEILVVADRTQLADTTAASGTVETPLNMRSDKIGGCPCPVLSAVTVNLSPNPALSMELAHEVINADVNGIAANALWGKLSLDYQPISPPFILGPAGFYVYWGGTVAVDGFAAVDFLAIPSSLVTGLV